MKRAQTDLCAGSGRAVGAILPAVCQSRLRSDPPRPAAALIGRIEPNFPVPPTFVPPAFAGAPRQGSTRARKGTGTIRVFCFTSAEHLRAGRRRGSARPRRRPRGWRGGPGRRGRGACATGRVRLRRHQAAVGVLAHPDDVGGHNPRVAVREALVEEIGESAGIVASLQRPVPEHHQPGNVVYPGAVPHPGEHVGQAGGLERVRVEVGEPARQWGGGVQRVAVKVVLARHQQIPQTYSRQPRTWRTKPSALTICASPRR